MNKTILILGVCFLLFVSACGLSGLRHITFDGVGKTTDEIIEKFGYPTRVDQGARDTEVWVYAVEEAGGSPAEYIYIIKDDVCVKTDFIQLD